jgi:hypothetical protein
MKARKSSFLMPLRHEKSCRRKISYRFVMKMYKLNLQEAVSSRKELPQKNSCCFVVKMHQQNSQETVSSRKKSPQKNFMSFRHENASTEFAGSRFVTKKNAAEKFHVISP